MPISLNGNYYTLDEAYKVLGYRTPDYLRALCNTNKIPCVKISKAWIIPEYWVKSQLSKLDSAMITRGQAKK